MDRDSAPLLLRPMGDLVIAEVSGLCSSHEAWERRGPWSWRDPRPPLVPSQQSTPSPFLPGLCLDPVPLCPTQNKPWKKLKTTLKYSPFVVSFRKHYPWVQLSGHAGESRGQGGVEGRQGCAERFSL